MMFRSNRDDKTAIPFLGKPDSEMNETAGSAVEEDGFTAAAAAAAADTCRDCCVRQRWKWSMPLTATGIIAALIGAVFASRVDNPDWLVAFFIFLGGIILVVFSVAIPASMSWMRRRGRLRYEREHFTPVSEPATTVDEETGSIMTEVELSPAAAARAKRVDHDFEAEL
jgi:hypothetical protein